MKALGTPAETQTQSDPKAQIGEIPNQQPETNNATKALLNFGGQPPLHLGDGPGAQT